MTLTRIFRVMALALVSSGVGCIFGSHVGTFAPANSPNGVTARLETSAGRVTAELLEVRDSGLVVLDNAKVTFVPYRSISDGSFNQLGVTIRNGQFQNAEKRNRARLVSRFPQGITPETERELLGFYHQTSIIVLGAK